jgi:hypothetical protein
MESLAEIASGKRASRESNKLHLENPILSCESGNRLILEEDVIESARP